MGGRQKHPFLILFLPYSHFTPDHLGNFFHHFKSLVSRGLQPLPPFSGQQNSWGGFSCLLFNLSMFCCVSSSFLGQVFAHPEATILENDPRDSVVRSLVFDEVLFLCLQPPTAPSWLMLSSELHKMPLEELREKSGQSSSKIIRFILFTTIWCLLHHYPKL